MRILIIGGAGYVDVLIEYLLSLGFNIRIYDNFIYKNNISILPFLNKNNFEFIYGDISSGLNLDKALNNITDVILLAGLVGDPITKKYPKESKMINELGIQNVIKLINGRGINKLIFVSTCSNYGLIDSDQLANEEYELKPLSLYANAKVSAEQFIISLKSKVDYSPTILRFATAFGLSPRMRFDLTISEFTIEMATGKELLVYDADTWRPYCHVRDFARLIEKVLEAPNQLVANQVFNAGGEVNNYTKKMIVDEILNFLPDAKVKFQKQGNDPRNYRVSFNKVLKILNFEPTFTVEDGILELLDSINNRVFDHVEEHETFMVIMK